jgi:TonB-linked SusC/RagA family outer membrane protein
MRNITFKLGLLLCVWLCCAAAFAQSVITGTVYEMFGSSKEPCAGVNISIVNDQNRVLTGTITDLAGSYSLKVPAGSKLTLVYSFIGMSTQRIAYTGQKVQDVTMSEDSKQIQEVVVASERVTKSDLGVSTKQFTGASQAIKMEQVMETVPVTSVEEALQGQLAGVDILAGGDPGAKGSIRIRGAATLNSNSDPLIVVNGVPYNTDISDDFDFATANTDDFADMLSLNPNDIENIEVLKDAASTALYGTKGANGVLLITTKKGTRGKPKFIFSNKTTVKIEPDAIPMLDGNEYTAYMQDAIWNTANARGLASSSSLLEQLFDRKSYAIGYEPEWSYFDEYNANTDWLGSIVQNAVTTDNNFSMSGGGEKATYRFSLGYTTEDGTTKGYGMSRLTSTLNIGYNFSDRLNVAAEFTYSDTENNEGFFTSSSVRTEAQRKMPNKSPYYIDDETKQATDIYFTYQDANEFQGAFSGNKSSRTGSNYHPIVAVNDSYSRVNTKEEKITFRPTYRILLDENDAPMLTYSGYVSMKFKTVKTRRFIPQEATGVNIESEWNNYSYDGYSNNLSLQSETKLLLNKNWKEGDHQLVAAAIWRTSQSQGSTYASSVYGTAAQGMSDPTTGGTVYNGSVNSGTSDARTLSLIGNFNYTFYHWLTLNATFNYEGNSALGKDNRWGLFQSYGGAIHLTEIEAIADKYDWLSQAKIRGSWGQSGQAPSGTSPYVGTYTALTDKYGTVTPVVPNAMQLNKLKWETTEELDFGADLGFMNNKLTMTVDWYRKYTRDLLQKSVKVSNVSSFSSIAYTNSGEMSNTGWEYRIDYELFKNKDWRVAVNFNINRNENKLEKLPDNLATDQYTMKNGNYAMKLIEGTPSGSFFGYRYKGVYQNTEDTYATDANGNVMRDLEGQPLVMKNGTYTCYPGDAKYEDINHDGKIDENDIVYIGNCNPMVTGGGGANISWKNFALTIFLHYRLGQKIINSARMNNEAMYNTDNQSKAVLRRWRNEGDDTDIPRALYNYGYNYLGSDRFVEDCSFVRLKTLSLSYKLPKKICEKFYAAGLNVFVTGYDLFTFTSYKGQDPEVTLPTSITDLAKDESTTPRSRRFAAGVTLTF